jgi:hypothetical protein
MIAEKMAGYTMGTSEAPHSPISLADFDLLKKTVLSAKKTCAISVCPKKF